MHSVKAADPKRLVRGDVVKVRIEVTAAAGRTWVIVNDPVPPGATIVSNLGGQSEMLADQADGSGRQPSYVERRKDRTDERRGGKGCVRTGRYGWSACQ